jgi:hypothetical protein
MGCVFSDAPALKHAQDLLVTQRKVSAMELTLIRECTREDIDAVVALDREWEQENIAYGDFNPIGRRLYSWH